jgi:multidrug efflux pump subunit AcrA (membrane-fusion protein)
MPKKLMISVAAACLIGFTGCSDRQAANSAESEAAAPVQVEPVTNDTIQRIITAEAVLYPLQQASIVPKISAPVQRFFVNRGDKVRRGQLLAVLENRDLVAAANESNELYRQAQATYESTTAATMPDDMTKATADVEAAQQALDSARKVYENRVALQREGALAQKLVDDAKVALVQAQSQFDTAQQHLKSLQTVGQAEQKRGAQAQMEAAKGHYESAAAQASYAEIRSPISGVIADRPLNLGEMASSGSALFSIVDTSRVVARANFSVQDAASIKVGDKVKITGAGGELTGKITVVSPAVDLSSTTVGVWAEAADPKRCLKLGTTASLAIDAGSILNAVVVPADAILSSDEGGEKVMVAGSDSLAHERKVKLGIRSGDVVQILSGVKPGEQVITQGALGLDDKAKIQIGKAEDKSGEDKSSDEGKKDE